MKLRIEDHHRGYKDDGCGSFGGVASYPRGGGYKSLGEMRKELRGRFGKTYKITNVSNGLRLERGTHIQFVTFEHDDVLDRLMTDEERAEYQSFQP